MRCFLSLIEDRIAHHKVGLDAFDYCLHVPVDESYKVAMNRSEPVRNPLIQQKNKLACEFLSI